MSCPEAVKRQLKYNLSVSTQDKSATKLILLCAFLCLTREVDSKMAFSMSNLNSSELAEVGAALGRPEEMGNRADVELQWAMKAMDHATVHYNLISSVDASLLRLTKLDDEIYQRFREEFPDFDVKSFSEDILKTPQAKEKWRNFCESFKNQVEDYNLGTLLRLNCEDDYSPETTTFSVRTQFLAIEIARNKEGHNSILLKKKQEKDNTVSENGKA